MFQLVYKLGVGRVAKLRRAGGHAPVGNGLGARGCIRGPGPDRGGGAAPGAAPAAHLLL